MLQESSSTNWDLRTMMDGGSASLRPYALVLLIVCTVIILRLVSLWWKAPPFRAERQRDNPAYPRLLRSSSASLKRWISLLYLAWGICASRDVFQLCDSWMANKLWSISVLVPAVRELADILTVTLSVGLFVLLIQWHISWRLENLTQS